MRAESESKTMPEFGSLDELVQLFDRQDFGEFLEQMPEADFEVDIKKRKHLLAIDDELAQKLTQIAGEKQISSEALVDSWLREKILERR